MKFKRFSILVTFIMVLTLVLSGCTKKEEVANNNKELKEFTVLLDWYPNAVHTFLYAAEKEGYFKEAGLKVKFITPASTDDGLKLVAADKFDLAISYPKQVVIARGENTPIVSVGAIVRSPLNQLMINKTANVKSLKDLEGKKIGYPSFEIDKATVSEMVKNAGGDPSKVEFIDVGYDLMPAMQTKRVDGIIGGYINHEKLLLEKDGMVLDTFVPADFGVPNNYELVFIADEKGAKEDSDKIKAFLTAAQKGFEYTKSNPKEALAELLKVQDQNFPLDKDIEEKSLNMLIPLMENNEGKFLTQKEEQWNGISDWLNKKQLLKNEVKGKDAFVELIK